MSRAFPREGGIRYDGCVGVLGDRIQDLLRRIALYEPWEVAIELLIIGTIVWLMVRFVQGTRAAGALRGIFVLFVMLVAGAVFLRVLGGQRAFPRLTYLTNGLFQIALLALIVVFQPELRRALIRLGETLNQTRLLRRSVHGSRETIEAVSDACKYLARARFGAIMVIERSIGLQGLVEGGTTLDARVSARLLQTIFFPGSALHDLAVLIRGDHVHAAGVQLPLAEPEDMPNPSFGSRHRAAVGVTRECDAIAIVVSEETGRIRVAERGRLSGAMTSDELRAFLIERLESTPVVEGQADGESAVFEESGEPRQLEGPDDTARMKAG